MFAKDIKCLVIEKQWISPTVFKLRFKPSRKINFSPGQFLSVRIPVEGSKKPLRRCYSFANSPEDAKKHGFEICVKEIPDGKGTRFLADLNPGDVFEASAPHGIFQFRPTEAKRTAVFIATASGIAPIRSILQSNFFKKNRPKHTIVLFGAKNESEILYRGEFEKLGIETVYAVSQPEGNWLGFKGRVTDILKNLPATWNWQHTDFYVCGTGEMAKDVENILTGCGVGMKNIHTEAYSPKPTARKRASIAQTLRCATGKSVRL